MADDIERATVWICQQPAMELTSATLNDEPIYKANGRWARLRRRRTARPNG